MTPGKDPAAAAAALRSLAFSHPPDLVGYIATPGGPRVFGVLMEIGYEKAVATLACFADGTTSLYYSTGGGVIGCGEHDTVAAAAKSLVALANVYLQLFAPTTTFPLPPAGSVRFYLRTVDGTLTVERSEKRVTVQGDPLFPLFYAANVVITAVRELGHV